MVRSARPATARRMASLLLALLAILAPGGAALAADCQPPPASMTGWWAGNGNALDSAGVNNGSTENGAGFAPGQVGDAFSFGGSGARVTIGNNVGDFGSDAFTAMFWLQADAALYTTGLPDAYLIGKSDPDAGLGWDVRFNDARIYVAGVDGWGFNIISDPLLTPGWHHVALTRADAASTLYIDGVARNTVSSRAISSTDNPLRFGHTTRYGGAAFRGLLDEVTLFARALSAPEVNAAAQSGAAGHCRIALASNLAPTAVGQTVRLVARVTGDSPAATGTVDFVADDSTSLCGAVALSGGTAVCAVNALTAGTHSLVATYAGDAQHAAGASAPLTHVVQANAVATLAVTRDGSASGTVTSEPPGIACGNDCSEPYATALPVTLTATPTPGAAFTGWLGACTGSAPSTLTPDVASSVTATFGPAALLPLRLDADASMNYETFADGMLAVRYLLGVRGVALAVGATASGATRTDPAALAAWFDDMRPVLDIDGDGQTEAATDGVLLLRYLLGFRGAALTANALAAGATRDGDAIATYLATLMP